MSHIEHNIIRFEDNIIDERYNGGAGYFCFHFMKKNGEKLAQIDPITGEQETYNVLLQKSIRTSIRMKEMGIKAGQIVAFCLKTDLLSCVPVIASFMIGAIPVYVDSSLPLIEIIYYLKSITPKLILVSSDILEEIYSFVRQRYTDTLVAHFNEDFFKALDGEDTFEPVYVTDLQQTAIIHFSSGTTGSPKAVYLNHYYLVCCKRLALENLWIENEPKVVFSYDSLHWTVESTRLMCSIREGICRVLGSDQCLDAVKIWHYLDKYRVNIAYLVPSILMKMQESDYYKQIKLNRLTTIFVEGGLLPTKYRQTLQKILPGVDIFNIYGTTEVGPLTVFRKTDLHRKFNKMKPNSVGLPIPGFDMSMKVVDLQTRKPVGPNTLGELCLKGKSVMNGYYMLESSQAFDEDGWLKTGDLVYYDEDLCFYIVNRIKESINYHCWHISPTLLEDELLTHPAVKQAVVIGIPQEEEVEHALGLVVLNRDCNDVSPVEIQKYIEGRVDERYWLRGGVKIVKDSLLWHGRKIKRLHIKQLVLSGKI